MEAVLRSVSLVRFFFILGMLLLLPGCAGDDWRTASRESSGLAPDPVTTSDAVLQVYAARAWGWRGWFAVHTWISAKPSQASHYRVYEVVGWRAHNGLPVLRMEQGVPDRYWYGEEPQLLIDYRGAEEVDGLIKAVEEAAKSYPWAKEYRAFPGPNSNTFTAWIAKEVPELKLDLPFSAIGSGYVN